MSTGRTVSETLPRVAGIGAETIQDSRGPAAGLGARDPAARRAEGRGRVQAGEWSRHGFLGALGQQGGGLNEGH